MTTELKTTGGDRGRAFCRKKPCSGCPFARHSKPGETGGADPLVFVAQAFGPFWLPCHQEPGYFTDRRDPRHAQCAGAAVFRSNVGVAGSLPDALHRLPADPEAVFATPVELLTHHTGMAAWVFELFLRDHPPESLAEAETRRAGVEAR